MNFGYNLFFIHKTLALESALEIDKAVQNLESIHKSTPLSHFDRKLYRQPALNISPTKGLLGRYKRMSRVIKEHDKEFDLEHGSGGGGGSMRYGSISIDGSSDGGVRAKISKQKR